MSKALVLLSGGIDSAVALAMAKQNCEKVLAMGVHYGQVNEARELVAAADVAKSYGVTFSVLPLPKSLFSGPLVNGEPMPDGHLRDIQQKGLSPAEVPFRNALLLSVAVSVAITTECSQVWHGIHAEHGTDWAYPDCSHEFLGAFASATWIGSGQRVRLISPFAHFTKTEVVAAGLRMHVPFELTYSCYKGEEQPCGVCIACKAREEAFESNYENDPATLNTNQKTVGVLGTDGRWYPKL